MPFYFYAVFDCLQANVAAAVDGFLELLPFQPEMMSVFYSEFYKIQSDRPFDKEWLLENISREELIGVTASTLYSKTRRRGPTEPFVILGFRPGDNSVRVEVRCIGFEGLDWLLNADVFLTTILCASVRLCYACFFRRSPSPHAYNVLQAPGIAEFRQREAWREAVFIESTRFVTSPIMFFGQGIQHIMPLHRFLLSPGSVEMEVCDSPVVRVDLFDLNKANSESYADLQRRFWETTGLFAYLLTAEKKNFVNGIEDYERRGLLYQKLKKEGRV